MGCVSIIAGFTINQSVTYNDSWAFVRGTVIDIETEKPTFTVEFSPVYNGFWDAEHILQLLKFIVAKHLEE